MRLGLFTLATDQSMPFHLLAQEAERRGFDAIFTGEHSHIPVGAQFWSGGSLPMHYRRLLDPFSALSAAAVATSKIKLGVGICLVALHNPIRLAKLVGSLDHISEGRTIFGMGYGYIDREAENHGVDFQSRKDVLRDKMRAMQEIWTNDVASYEGPYVSFRDCELYPKAFKRKRPTVLLGAKLRGETIRDMVELCDGWLPSAMMGGEHLSEDIARLKREWAQAGKDTKNLEVTVFHTAKTGAERRDDDWGAAELTEAIVDSYEEAGAKTLCVPLPPAGRDVILPYLDHYAKVLENRLRT